MRPPSLLLLLLILQSSTVADPFVNIVKTNTNVTFKVKRSVTTPIEAQYKLHILQSSTSTRHSIYQDKINPNEFIRSNRTETTPTPGTMTNKIQHLKPSTSADYSIYADKFTSEDFLRAKRALTTATKLLGSGNKISSDKAVNKKPTPPKTTAKPKGSTQKETSTVTEPSTYFQLSTESSTTTTEPFTSTEAAKFKPKEPENNRSYIYQPSWKGSLDEDEWKLLFHVKTLSDSRLRQCKDDVFEHILMQLLKIAPFMEAELQRLEAQLANATIHVDDVERRYNESVEDWRKKIAEKAPAIDMEKLRNETAEKKKQLDAANQTLAASRFKIAALLSNDSANERESAARLLEEHSILANQMAGLTKKSKELQGQKERKKSDLDQHLLNLDEQRRFIAEFCKSDVLESMSVACDGASAEVANLEPAIETERREHEHLLEAVKIASIESAPVIARHSALSGFYNDIEKFINAIDELGIAAEAFAQSERRLKLVAGKTERRPDLIIAENFKRGFEGHLKNAKYQRSAIQEQIEIVKDVLRFAQEELKRAKEQWEIAKNRVQPKPFDWYNTYFRPIYLVACFIWLCIVLYITHWWCKQKRRDDAPKGIHSMFDQRNRFVYRGKREGADSKSSNSSNKEDSSNNEEKKEPMTFAEASRISFNENPEICS